MKNRPTYRFHKAESIVFKLLRKIKLKYTDRKYRKSYVALGSRISLIWEGGHLSDGCSNKIAKKTIADHGRQLNCKSGASRQTTVILFKVKNFFNHFNCKNIKP